MRKIFAIGLFVAVCGAGFLLWQNKPALLRRVMGEEFLTFKTRVNAEKIMETHKKDLLASASSSFLEPKTLYFPYLLMEVKYNKTATETCEGHLLWGMCDGEMVLDVESWKKSHGFEDCLLAGVGSGDFKILRAVAKSGGLLEKSKAIQQFGDECEKWIATCVQKKLIIDNGKVLRLHLQNPILESEPLSKIGEKWVRVAPSACVKKKYSPAQVKKMTHSAFGEDFAIRRTLQLHLPVYEISVQHEDGSVLKTLWNALNGKQIDEHLREI